MPQIEKASNAYWDFYTNNSMHYVAHESGKWMVFFEFEDMPAIAKHCENIVLGNICGTTKLSNVPNDKNTGVACFYLNISDKEAHKKLIKYMIDNDLIPRTQNGRLYNIGFKLDNQTRSGQYGSDFIPTLKLADLVDLNTDKFI